METAPLRVLIVDDSPEDRLSLRRLLTRTTPSAYIVAEASRGDQALAACATTLPDCLLLDYRLPDMDGLAVLAALRAQSDVPVVLLTGVGSETLAVETLQRGAQDYLVKDALTAEHLGLTIRHAVAEVRLTRERDQTLALLTTMLDALPVGVAVLDPSLQVRHANPALANLMDHTAGQLHGQPLPDFWPALAAPCAQLLRGEPFHDLELCLPAAEASDVRWLSVSGTPLPGTNGADRMGLLTVQDITARRQAEIARLTSEARFRAIIEHGTEGMVLLGADSSVRYVSPPITALLGYSPETFAALGASDLCHPDDQPQLETFIATLTAQPGATAQVTTRLRHQDGTWRWIEQRGHNQTDSVDIAGIMVSFRDVTERVRAEQVAQATATRLQILADTSHAFTEMVADEPTLLNRIALLTAEPLGASCGIWLRSADSAWLLPMTVYDHDPAVQQLLQTVYKDAPIPLTAAHPTAVVARSGRPLLFPFIDPAAMRAALAPEQWAAFARVRPHSSLVVPLPGHGTTLGSLVFTRHDPAQPAFTAGDLALAQDLADRVALALANTRLYQQALAAQQTAAEALARLDALLTSVPIGIGYLDRELRYQLINPALAAINARPPAEHLGQTPHELIPGMAPRLEPLMRQVLATGEAVRDLELHGQPCPTDGKSHDWLISYFPVREPDGVVSGVGVSMTDITQSKQVAAALHRSEQMLRLFVTHAPAAIAMFDRAMHYLAASNRYLADYRLAEQPVIGRSHYELFPEIPERWRASHQRCLAGASEQCAADSFPRADGTLDWVRWELHPWYEPTGEVGGLILFSEVITAHKQAEEALRASETRYRILFETMVQGVVYQDRDGQIIDANPAAEQILGLTLDELHGRTSLDPRWHTIHEDGTPFPGEAHPALVALRTGQEVRDVVMGVYHPGLEAYRWITVQAVPQVQPGTSDPMQVYTLFDDITERRATAQVLEHERRQLAAILDMMHEGVMAAGPDGRLVLVNPAALKICNLDPTHPPASLAEVVQQSGQEVITPEGQLLPSEHWPIPRVLRGEHFVGLELGLRSPQDGTTRWHSFNGTPVSDQDGTLILGVVTGQDITARKRDEAQLHQQAAMLDHAHVLIRDAESRIVFWNQGAGRLYGWTTEEAIGQISHELLQTRFPTSLEEVQAELVATGRWEGELIHHRRDGSDLVVASLQILFRDPSGAPTHILEVNNDVTALKRAEEALREREAQLRQAYEAAELSTVYVDVARGTVTLDARARMHYGVTDETLSFAGFAACIYPEDLVWLQRESDEARQPGYPDHANIEYRVIHPDGSVHWIASHIRFRFTGAGPSRSVVGAYRVNQDITARKAHEAALHAAYAQVTAQAARLESLLAYAPVGISLLDTELRFQHINAPLAAMNGLPPEAHLGRTLGEVLPALTPVLEPIYRQVLATSEPLLNVEVHGETPAAPGLPRVWQASYFPVRERTGTILGVGVMILDITAQRQAEQARQVAYQQLETILQTLDEGVMAVAPDGRFVLINPAACQQLRLNPAALPRTIAELDMPTMVTLFDQAGAPIPGPERPVSRALRGDRFQNLELRMRVAGAPEERWMLFSGAPVYAADGALLLAVVTGNDITQRKRDAVDLAAHAERLSHTNAQLTRALQLKDEFLAMMSHELRTPLNVILSTTDAFTEAIYGPVSERQQKALATIDRSGHHLLAILNDILDLTALEAGHARLELQRVDVEILCRRATQFVQAAAQQKQIHVLRTMAVGVEGLRADERRLIQILVNLLDNAVKFTPMGGQVGLEVTIDAAEEQITFTVWDTGIGIAEADYARLFHPFTQVDGRLARQFGGIGLGLTLVRRLVELHGGSIRLDSTPGQGSRFTVSLPWRAEDNLAPDTLRVREPRIVQPWAHPPRVVIADDHELTLQFYDELLREHGCEVVLARTGKEALAQIQATRPDVAVLDIQLPELDGLTVIRQLRADPVIAATPVIALTALAMPGDRERCLEAGANAYLAKPVGVRTLLTTIAEVLTHMEVSPARD